MTLTREQIMYMVNRFLGWRLPEDFDPDAGISFKPNFNEDTANPMKHEPTGTNLFDATQAENMVRYLVDGMPNAAPPAESKPGETDDNGYIVFLLGQNCIWSEEQQKWISPNPQTYENLMRIVASIQADKDHLLALVAVLREDAAAAELSFKGFSRINLERCEALNGFNHRLRSWSTSDWFLALIGEIGEAANAAKKLNRVRDGIPGNKVSKEDLQQQLRCELGDAFVYLDLLAQSVGVDIGEAAREVFNAKSKELDCPIVMSRAAAEQTVKELR
jgi:NTP pyrophosphatase (non-canonical NTP hydrolase)